MYIFIAFITLFPLTQLTSANAINETANVLINWHKTFQRIDGFGTHAGQPVPVFESAKRDKIMEMLFGDSGLRLNIIRTKIQHTFEFNNETGIVNVKPPNIDVNISVNSLIYQNLTTDYKDQLAQLWILKEVSKRNEPPIVFASVWTPPLEMKKHPNEISAKDYNGLSPEFYEQFADYLTGFIEAYQNEGIDLFAISPTNEPENIFSPWDCSYWEPLQLTKFINEYLKPKLDTKQIAIKIMASENAAWGTANLFLSAMNKSNIDIYAGHGYTEIADLVKQIETKSPTYNQKAEHWSFSTDNKPVWQTEISNYNGIYDNSIKEGLLFAKSLHKFLTKCNVNAFVWWDAKVSGKSNEGLICTNHDGSLDVPKTYEVMGQFSRYIRQGYVRIDANVTNGNVLVSAYKEPLTGKLTIVAINENEHNVPLTIQLDGITISKLNIYRTDSNDERWRMDNNLIAVNGTFQDILSGFSVTTFTGIKKL